MATFSQFKSKYITERRSKNIGDEGTKNIVKKLLGKDAIPDDGGKAGQARIERELGLNKTDKLKNEISNRKLEQLKKQELLKKQMGTLDDLSDGGNTSNTNVRRNVIEPKKFSSGATGTTPSGSPEMGGESKKFVQSRRRKLQTKVIRPKPEYDLIGNKIGDKKGSQIFNQNKISNTTSGKTKIELPKFSQQSVNKAGGSSQTFIKPKNFSQFRQGAATLNKVKPLTKVVRRLGVAGAIADAGVSGYQSYSDSQKRGDTKSKSLGRSLATVGGGIIGGTLGAAIASPIPIPGARIAGGYAGYQYGKDYGTRAYDALTTRKGRMKFKDFVGNVGKSIASKK